MISDFQFYFGILHETWSHKKNEQSPRLPFTCRKEDGDQRPVSILVVFFDVEREVNIEDVVMFSSMAFKNFQSILSQKIGISPHQISIFLGCQRNRDHPWKLIEATHKRALDIDHHRHYHSL